MTGTTPSLPMGAVCIDGWQATHDNLPPYRVVSGRDRRVRGCDGIVGTSAVQYPDGSIDQTEQDSPRIWAEYGAASLTSTQAREFAAAIIAAADEVDGWMGQ